MSINTTAGQNISLPCVIETDEKNIAQIHWKRITAGNKEHSIAIFNPQFPPVKYEWNNVSLDIEDHSQKLRGSILQLQEVDNWASGQYMCELTIFPDGTVKRVTNLLVIDVKLSASVTWLNQSAGEGVKVMILCNSTPSADNYFLWPSKDKSSVLRNETGLFLLHEVMRESDDVYVCQPEWSLSHPLHGQNLTTQVRVCCKCDEPSHSHKGGHRL
ncbi:uncharacterized protein LOC118774489 [Megalops cyprinoides]|uniref:uncharacterized protein LOC118774489 n=1 Tax=Megalops cyprinoides TaxID=118141 RepID=UPI0018655106|nr:uncharacterized protein LOC118774489 [Megalops cyprinoides]